MGKKKLCLTAVCCAGILAAGLSGGSVLAWLTDSAGPVKNTFIVGKVRLTLTETWNTDSDGDGDPDTWSALLIPGTELPKDPVVTVDRDSEDCWIFVKLTEQNWPGMKEADGITRKAAYSIADGWEVLPGEANVYFRQVASAAENKAFSVLKDNRITVSHNLTKQEISTVSGMELSITAWAIQSAGMKTAEEAWHQLTA